MPTTHTHGIYRTFPRIGMVLEYGVWQDETRLVCVVTTEFLGVVTTEFLAERIAFALSVAFANGVLD